MALKHLYRTHWGSHFSEGHRVLWVSMLRSKQSAAELSRALSISTGYASKLLYGDQSPGRDLAVRIQELYDVPIEAWSKKPTRKFQPPAAKRLGLAATGTDGR